MSQANMGQASPSFDAKKIFPTPNYDDKIVVEVVSRKLENYVELVYGTAHPDATALQLFPNHRLVLQVEQNEEFVVRFYAADRAGEDLYNASISYLEESNAHPIFTRDYIVRRSAYAVLTKLVALTGLVNSAVTAGGTGYTQDTTTVSLSGGTGSGGAVSAIVSNGAVIGLYVTARGNYTVAPSVTINSTSGGAGAAGNVSIQLQTAVLVKEDMLAKTGDERIDSLYVLVRRKYETLPGPILSAFSRSEEVRGKTVTTTKQEGATGTLAPETGNYIISSVETPLDSVRDERITKKLPASLPADEVWIEYRYKDIPKRLFSITNTLVCGDTDSAAVTVEQDALPAGSFLRPHRITISYSLADPGETALASYTPATLIYDGLVVNVNEHGVLNDELTYTADFHKGACEWTEAYSFAASSPSATEFEAGHWYLVSRTSDPFGDTMYRTKTVEFYSLFNLP